MEQYSQYLMSVMKSSRNILMNPYSWEEQAFAEDARGPLGGFVWPPRSYSCSFCRREFRSAQALGGHMNVHRREKAKLKQTVNNANTLTTPQNYNDKLESLCESFDPGFFSPRISSMPALAGSQESTLDSSSDTKSSVYDGDFLVAHGNADVETNLVLGFDLDSCSKRRKITNHDTTPIMAGCVDVLDLELRLAS